MPCLSLGQPGILFLFSIALPKVAGNTLSNILLQVAVPEGIVEFVQDPGREVPQLQTVEVRRHGFQGAGVHVDLRAGVPGNFLDERAGEIVKKYRPLVQLPAGGRGVRFPVQGVDAERAVHKDRRPRGPRGLRIVGNDHAGIFRAGCRFHPGVVLEILRQYRIADQVGCHHRFSMPWTQSMNGTEQKCGQ